MKVLFAIVGVTALAALAYTYTDSARTQGSAPPNTEEIVITLTEDGFIPSTLTLDTGTTVTFVSDTGAFFWPASNPHPTHTIYSAFDPQEPVRPDGKWSFVFTEEGTWRYHDHLAPYYTGTITVASKPQ